MAVLEVLVFGRDAGMAEAWLCSQEPLVRSAELGCTVDEVESLIKRHEAFQKSAVAWEERFSALEKLTAVRTVGPQRSPTPLQPSLFLLLSRISSFPHALLLCVRAKSALLSHDHRCQLAWVLLRSLCFLPYPLLDSLLRLSCFIGLELRHFSFSPHHETC